MCVCCGSRSSQERGRLDIVSEFHLGDFVNRIHRGSLVMVPTAVDDDTAATVAAHITNRLLYATVSGAVGVMFTLSPSLFAFLNRLQNAVRR